ncbi:MAG: hypothetical protein ACTHJ4_07625 [Candidatus Nucleicultricaceae bacterium]
MKSKNLALIALASLIFSQTAFASKNFGDGEDIIQRINRAASTKTLTAPKAEESYWSWGVSLVNKHRATIATGLLMATSIGIAAYAYFSGEEEASPVTPQTGYSYSHTNFDFNNMTSEVSLLDSFGNVIINGVCSLVKTAVDADTIGYQSDCSDFYEQVKAIKH